MDSNHLDRVMDGRGEEDSDPLHLGGGRCASKDNDVRRYVEASDGIEGMTECYRSSWSFRIVQGNFIRKS